MAAALASSHRLTSLALQRSSSNPNPPLASPAPVAAFLTRNHNHSCGATNTSRAGSRSISSSRSSSRCNSHGWRSSAAPFSASGPSRMRAGAAFAAAQAESATSAEPQEIDTWQVKVLYDGDCPICMKQVEFLSARNKQYQTLKFVDISTEDYDPDENGGVEYEEAMGHMHGVMRDGTVVKSMDAFRSFYDAVGLGWIINVTNFPPIAVVVDAMYELFAKYRLPLTGHPGIQAAFEERKRTKYGIKGCTEEDPCEVEY
ncbi:hypothetical protein CLOM_g8331 [Closterium sp. NIES-68]|nr:hypothetical protein CLOM_g8331 [Closterium sp. NIES-68]GJP59257.1 hypothetical protein CLOP_g10070 [Closterium sp. NIES-67]